PDPAWALSARRRKPADSDRHSHERLVAVGDALGNRAETHYDVAGNVVRRLARGHPAGRPDLPHVVLADVRFWHDELGRVFRREDDLFLSSGVPLRPVELRDHDGDGVVVARFEYDALSRLVATVEDDLEVAR